mmetsp:Transcript_655/g.1751  ORF Transcript_655/g.1751 Transcript_655/m.1751 type:complete len:402 (+) Transcript_655:826-2031(+)
MSDSESRRRGISDGSLPANGSFVESASSSSSSLPRTCARPTISCITVLTRLCTSVQASTYSAQTALTAAPAPEAIRAVRERLSSMAARQTARVSVNVACTLEFSIRHRRAVRSRAACSAKGTASRARASSQASKGTASSVRSVSSVASSLARSKARLWHSASTRQRTRARGPGASGALRAALSSFFSPLPNQPPPPREFERLCFVCGGSSVPSSAVPRLASRELRAELASRSRTTAVGALGSTSPSTSVANAASDAACVAMDCSTVPSATPTSTAACHAAPPPTSAFPSRSRWRAAAVRAACLIRAASASPSSFDDFAAAMAVRKLAYLAAAASVALGPKRASVLAASRRRSLSLLFDASSSAAIALATASSRRVTARVRAANASSVLASFVDDMAALSPL